jgi:serine phosphatase RsbU (regulator of sigma subunit)
MTLMSQLSTLESAGLIRLAQYEPDLEYLFRHALVQDAAYATLLSSDRKRLHRVVGEALEQIYPDRLNEHAATLARHFEEAGDHHHALRYFERAGDAALATYANQEAESQYRSALDLSASPAQRAKLQAGLGEALFRQSRFEAAIQSWSEAIDLYTALGDSEGMARFYARSARAAWHAGDQPEGLRLCQEGLEAVSSAPQSADLALLMHEAGRAYFFNGQPDRAVNMCQRALDLAERIGAVEVQADTLATLGVMPDQPAEQALTALRRSAELAESAGLLEVGVRAHHNLATTIKGRTGDLHAARSHFVRAAELARQRGAVQEELLAQGSVAGISLVMGDLDAVEQLMPELDRMARAIPTTVGPQYALDQIRAVLLQHRGAWDQALALWRSYYRRARQRGDLQGRLDAALGLAELLTELDRLGELPDGETVDALLAEAEAALEDAMEVSQRGIGGGNWARFQMSSLRARQGHLDQAHQLLEECQADPTSSTVWDEVLLALAQARLAGTEKRWSKALAAYEAVAARQIRMGERLGWAHTLLEWAQAHVSRAEGADLERAQALLREAHTVFEEAGVTYYAQLVERQLQAIRARTVAQAIALSQVTKELAVAGRIQEGLLPRETPYFPGWQLAATLEPARETSGDFYDFIAMPNGHLGLVMADVADKGAGAALYMALSRTLIRTYATQYPTQPEQTLRAVNQRILAETRADMFVTIFYGILDPETGRLSYCNGGHNPPYLLKSDGIKALERTGLPLGILEDANWEQESASMAPGDLLVLYTDGVIDAQSSDGEFFGQERLLELLEPFRKSAASQVEETVLKAIHSFVGDAPRFDDLTLMVVARTVP